MPAERRRLRAILSVSFPADAAESVEQAAALRHQPISVFVRDSAIERANRLLGLEPSEPAPAKAAA